MKKMYIILAFVAVGISSCENKERLEEIKASITLKNGNNTTIEPKVSLQIPSIFIEEEESSEEEYDKYGGYIGSEEVYDEYGEGEYTKEEEWGD